MPKKRYRPEEILSKLREADALISQGKKVVEPDSPWELGPGRSRPFVLGRPPQGCRCGHFGRDGRPGTRHPDPPGG